MGAVAQSIAEVAHDGPHTLVVGLGRTGLSCARFLSRLGVPVAVTDSRELPPALADLRQELPDVGVFIGGFDAQAFARAEQLVVSPGVPLSEPLIAQAITRGIPVLGDIELFARHARAPVIAVTGSNGKSTVTTLLGEMARRAGVRAAVGGNLGTPALELLPGSGEVDPALYVLELSSFQLETTHSLSAAAAVVLNVSADHLDRHGDLARYAAIKARAYRGDGVMVVNADDPIVSGMAVAGRRITRFTLGVPGDRSYGVRSGPGGDYWLARGVELLLPVAELRMAGRHNVANALAALALGESVQLPRRLMVATLREFGGLPHRCQWVATLDGAQWYNDSKGTNVGATEAACNGFPGPIVLIAGGLAKGQDFTPLRGALAGKIRGVVLIGQDAPRLRAALGGVAPLVEGSSMREAVARARELAQPGDQVLLSPACASFDMFRDYQDRGESFVREVRRLQRQRGGHGE